MRNLNAIRELVDYAATVPLAAADVWNGWHLTPISGGYNNRVVRAQRDHDDLAIKWTIRDERRRAYREYCALAVLAAHAPELAPHPVLLDEDTQQPVVVQRWLAATPLAGPPTDDAAWAALIAHYAAIHTLTPHGVQQRLLPAVLTAFTWREGLACIDVHVSAIPVSERPPALMRLVRRLEHMPARSWPAVDPVLCRVDANWRNMIPTAGVWRSVDWENSGWGDPAFEIAELTMHPAYSTISEPRWTQVIAHYDAIQTDRTLLQRIATYRRVMAAWWAARLYRSLLDVRQGNDQRLVPRAADWAATTTAQYESYLQRAYEL